MNFEKQKLIDQLRADRAAFEELLRPIDSKQLIHLRVSGEWTIKDVLAHITAWEIELLSWLQEAGDGQPPLIPGPGEWSAFIERFNNRTFQANRDRPLEDVLLKFQEVYAQVLVELQTLPDDPSEPYWSVWLDGVAPWDLLATFAAHYREHGEQIDRLWAQYDR